MRARGRSAVLAVLLSVAPGVAQPSKFERGPGGVTHGPGMTGAGPAGVVVGKTAFNVAAYAVLAFETDQLTGADGSEILAWPNTGSMGASGNATGTTGTAPKLYANVVNGKPVARFTANRQIVSTADPVLTGGVGVFVVASHSAASSYPMLFSISIGSPAVIELRCSGTTLRPEFFCGNSVVAAAAIPTATWNLLEGFHNGTAPSGYLNGTQWGAGGNVALPPSGPITVGNRGGAFAYQFVGDLAAVLVVNKPISTADRQSVEGYLAWKYGIQASLPAGHPYKASPP